MSASIKDSNYINIQGWMVTELGLKGSELLIYAVIFGISQDGSSRYHGGLNYLAEWTNSTKRSVINHLKSLCDRGLLVKEERYINNIKMCEYSVPVGSRAADSAVSKRELPEGKRLEEGGHPDEGEFQEGESLEEEKLTQGGGEKISPGVKNLPRGGEKISPGVVKKIPQGGEKFSPNNKRDNKRDNKKDNIEYTSCTCQHQNPDAGDAACPANILEVINAWNALTALGIRPVSQVDSSSKRYKSLQARLRQYGIDEVLKAIDNIRHSPFLLGNNKRGWTVKFDWFVLPNNFPKVLEGNYMDQPYPGKGDTDAGCTGRIGGFHTGYQQAQGTADAGGGWRQEWDSFELPPDGEG